MEDALKDLLFQLGCGKKSLINDYISIVANKGLTSYKRIIQTGKKEGESLYTHVLNGIFVFERLRPLLNLSEMETKVIMTVYSVHDLNKLEQFAHYRSYNPIGVKENFAEELERIGLQAFFPEYQDYLEDITTLARSHSAHLHTVGELWVKSHNPYQLGRERIEDLRHILRAMDVIDLSHTLEERPKKDAFLFELNTFLSKQTPVKQYEFQWHQISENRGILTNIIHNRIAEYLETHCACIPLLFYPDGVAYLVEKNREITFTDHELKAISQSVSASINKMTRSKFSTDFINSTISGIKVDAKFREVGMSFEEIFTEIYNMIVNRSYQKRMDDMVSKARERVLKSAENKVGKLKEQNEQETLLQKYREIAQTPEIMSASDEGMRSGELLRSYYIFLNDHYKKQIPNAWEHLYTLLNIEASRKQFYEAFEARYDRAYVVAKDLNRSPDEMLTWIIETGKMLDENSTAETQASLYDESSPIEKYVRTHVNVSFLPPQKNQFIDNLRQYTKKKYTQCCYCGSDFDTAKWMTADVPPDVKVQYFSNQLEGGQREPKRHICEICNIQFILHKLNYPGICPGGVTSIRIQGEKLGFTTYYLHLFPYSFYSDLFLRAIKTEINRLQGMDIQILYPKTEAAIREFMKSQEVDLRFSSTKRNGFPLPKFAEVQGNMLLFPINCVGKDETERFLFAVESALLIQKYMGCKVVLTDSSVGLVEKTEFDDVYIDSIPVAFSGWLRTNNLSKEELAWVWKRLTSFYKIKGLVYSDGKEVVELIRALTEDEFSLYYVCERLLLKKIRNTKEGTDKDWQEIHLSKLVSDEINAIIQRGEQMEQLKMLAKIAWEGKLKGESLKKNSLMMPFDMAFDKLKLKSEFTPLETVQAALTEDIFAFLERIASEDYKPGGAKREKVKAFTEAFFSGLLKGVYQDNLNKLLADEKILKSAFLFYVREQIPGKKIEEAS